MTSLRQPVRSTPAESGFSLIELLVALVVMAQILVAVLVLFDSLNRTTRVQTQIADMQQSVRVAQYDMVRLLRMAGRGGLGVNLVPNAVAPAHFGSAIEIRNNVQDGVDDQVAIGTASPVALAGTDILTVRGALNAPLYLILAQNPNSWVPNPGVGALVQISNPGPGALPQSLAPLAAAITDAAAGSGPTSIAVIVVPQSSNQAACVVEAALTDPNTQVIGPPADPTSVQLQLFFGNPCVDSYCSLAPGANPNSLTTVSALGILEEFRFYVRKEYEVPGAATSDLTPRLSMAQMLPGSEAPLGGDPANLQLDLADNIVDLQVALGLDTDYHGATIDDADFVNEDDTIFEGADAGTRVNDDWLYNASGDDETAAFWVQNATDGQTPNLYYLRLLTLAVSDQKDPSYRAPALTWLEDHQYTGANQWLSGDGLMYRRRLLQTVVDLRNFR